MMNDKNAFAQTNKLFERKPWLLAILITAALTLWMLSGAFGSGSNAKASETVSKLEKKELTKVRAEKKQAQLIERVIRLHGRTEADRRSDLKAEVAGKVEAILVDRGQWVEAGQVLVRLATEDKALRLQKAQASLNQRQLEYQGADRLRQQGLNAQTKLAEAEANLELAKAEVKEAALVLEKTKITAPFAGIFNERKVEVGDHLAVGAEIGELLDVEPIVVRGNIPELEFAEVALNQTGSAELITGETFQGKVRYLSSSANDATHTFRVELAIDNPSHKIPLGVSASIGLNTRQVLAYKVSPANLSLGENGGIGIKVVDQNETVHFKPVKLVRSEVDGSWVSGLDEEENIITVGQGFVSDGDKVAVNYVGDTADSDSSPQIAAKTAGTVTNGGQQ